jgi:hypothetical protein
VNLLRYLEICVFFKFTQDQNKKVLVPISISNFLLFCSCVGVELYLYLTYNDMLFVRGTHSEKVPSDAPNCCMTLF